MITVRAPPPRRTHKRQKVFFRLLSEDDAEEVTGAYKVVVGSATSATISTSAPRRRPTTPPPSIERSKKRARRVGTSPPAPMEQARKIGRHSFDEEADPLQRHRRHRGTPTQTSAQQQARRRAPASPTPKTSRRLLYDSPPRRNFSGGIKRGARAPAASASAEQLGIFSADLPLPLRKYMVSPSHGRRGLGTSGILRPRSASSHYDRHALERPHRRRLPGREKTPMRRQRWSAPATAAAAAAADGGTETNSSCSTPRQQRRAAAAAGAAGGREVDIKESCSTPRNTGEKLLLPINGGQMMPQRENNYGVPTPAPGIFLRTHGSISPPPGAILTPVAPDWWDHDGAGDGSVFTPLTTPDIQDGGGRYRNIPGYLDKGRPTSGAFSEGEEGRYDFDGGGNGNLSAGGLESREGQRDDAAHYRHGPEEGAGRKSRLGIGITGCSPNGSRSCSINSSSSSRSNKSNSNHNRNSSSRGHQQVCERKQR